jgi:hypothetical protein
MRLTNINYAYDISIAIGVANEVASLWDDLIGNGDPSSASGRSFRGRHSHTQLSHGYKLLGAGLFSVVVHSQHFPNTVVKYSNRDDDAYFHYALWCRANPNPHAPKILHIQKLEVGYVVIMPKYEPYLEVASMSDTIRSWAEDIASYPFSDPEPACVAKYPPSLGAFARELGLYFDRICPLDMHDENVMWDGHTLIITDPVSYNDRRNTNAERNKRRVLEEQVLPREAQAPVFAFNTRPWDPVAQAA